jgi:hypothetical protein
MASESMCGYEVLRAETKCAYSSSGATAVAIEPLLPLPLPLPLPLFDAELDAVCLSLTPEI